MDVLKVDQFLLNQPTFGICIPSFSLNLRSSSLSLRDNPILEQLCTIPDTDLWQSHSNLICLDVYQEGTMYTFTLFTQRETLFLLYIFTTWSGETIERDKPISNYPLIGIFKSQGTKGLIAIPNSHLLHTKVGKTPLDINAKDSYVYRRTA